MGDQMQIYDMLKDNGCKPVDSVFDEFTYSPRTEEWSDEEKRKLGESVKGFNLVKDGDA